MLDAHVSTMDASLADVEADVTVVPEPMDPVQEEQNLNMEVDPVNVVHVGLQGFDSPISGEALDFDASGGLSRPLNLDAQ